MENLKLFYLQMIQPLYLLILISKILKIIQKLNLNP